MSHTIYPLPELLAPGVWEIEEIDSGAHVIPEDRIVAVPLEATRYARAVRAHELAHVCFSPARIEFESLGVGRWTLLAVEDARVNELASRAGLDVIADLDDPTAAVPDPRTDLRAATLLLIASHATRGFERIFAAYGEAGGAGRLACHLALRVLEPIVSTEALPDFGVTVEGARLLRSRFGPEPPEWEHLGRCHTHAVRGRRRGEDRARSLFRRRGRWGVLRRVEEPSRPVIGRRGGLPAAARPADEGSILRAPHRLLVDGRVFAHPMRRRAGSVLIDGSASMSWNARKLEALLEAAPAAVVACYEGNAEGWGVLRVLARNGRRVADDAVRPPLGKGGNVVDGPALRWLARQPPPRVWVSDGHVTGVGDHFSPRLVHQAEAICAAASIVRVSDANAARLALSRR
jgi:hypothetical protein